MKGEEVFISRTYSLVVWTELREGRPSRSSKVFRRERLNMASAAGSFLFRLLLYCIIHTLSRFLGKQHIWKDFTFFFFSLLPLSLHELHYWQLYKYSVWSVHVWVRCSIKLGILVSHSNVTWQCCILYPFRYLFELLIFLEFQSLICQLIWKAKTKS